MKTLNLENLEKIEGGNKNCGGIYNSCIVASAVVGASIVLATAGWASLLGVAVAGSGMEYCRQQAIGCYGEA